MCTGELRTRVPVTPQAHLHGWKPAMAAVAADDDYDDENQRIIIGT